MYENRRNVYPAVVEKNMHTSASVMIPASKNYCL